MDYKNGAMEGLVIEIDGHVRAVRGSASVSHDESSTKITFPILGEGEKRLVLIRV